MYGFIELSEQENFMTYFFIKLAVLVLGMCILIAGILMDKKSGQSFQSRFADAMAWSGFFFICYGAEFVVLESA